jgi:hypothetical protein
VIWTFVFRCRLCESQFQGASTGCGEEAMLILAQVARGIAVPMVGPTTVHRCTFGRFGVADIYGVEPSDSS